MPGPKKSTVAGSKSTVQKFVFKGAGMASQGKSKHVEQYIPASVALNLYDRASGLHVSRDQMTVTTDESGYKMIRATHGVHAGQYYWELKVLPPLDACSGAHVRVGWSTRQGHLQAHVGFDKWSFGYRDIGGSRCHAGVRDDVYGKPFTVGDVVGCFIQLDTIDSSRNEIRFYLNGQDQGIAYHGEEIAAGVYFPAVSLFNRASVMVNYGPSFIFEHNTTANAISELQPMAPASRKMHEELITKLRAEKKDELSH